MTPTVTVLIPNYNNEPYIKECFDSIYEQTFKQFDVLVVDDSSTDNSVNLILEYQNKIKLKVIKKDCNTGIIDTLNIGLKKINSDYIIRMDADDIMHKERIKKLVDFMEMNPEIGACGSAIQHFGISKELIIYEPNPNQNKANLIFGHSIGHASCIYRNSVLKKHNIKYSKGYQFMEDFKFFYDLSSFSKLTSIPDILYFYRREEYNNYRNKDIIKKGIFKLYKETLNNLNITPTENLLQIHYDLGTLIENNFSFKEYNNHCKQLIKQNNILSIYPKKELKKVIQKKLNQITFKLIDIKKISFIKSLTLSLKNPNIGYYWLKSKI